MLVYSSILRTFGPDKVASGNSVTPSLRHSMSMGKSPSVTVHTARSRLPRVKFFGNVNDSTTGATVCVTAVFESSCDNRAVRFESSFDNSAVQFEL